MVFLRLSSGKEVGRNHQHLAQLQKSTTSPISSVMISIRAILCIISDHCCTLNIINATRCIQVQIEHCYG